MRRIYLAGGCFWGMQGYFQKLNGVVFTTVGYANSNIHNPTYQQVKKQLTNAVETLEIYYQESQISLQEILDHFFDVIDPTALNYQADDFGTQYRNGVYYELNDDLTVIESKINSLRPQYAKPIVTEVQKITNYFLAEEEHQNYTDKHPEVICHIKF
ncbi:peptide-methionine (S)-S-oxide reductase MsrA [Ureaplasma miroungigenitalium]|uniref:peptide-methionine (S)-S-oxide reductase MsrA n=1 Tax=Ureaplasma miroungigenitalium TaxID=1042321 RepID=UPI0021E819F6|nr:peptide-methionine (S)-S-oxide reductase MsrA [Ureaplasma miroungigenitalium]MCV3734211.1 peptide-methionine (S)-S-oxide reductase MsrA [Ureaplasma miroungigenitalium]